MIAVQGIEMLPVKESSADSSVEVKKKGEISPFDKLMGKDESLDKSEGPERLMKPARAEEPVTPRVYSAKKIAALLRTGKEEGLIDGDVRPDFSVLKALKNGHAAGEMKVQGNRALDISYAIPEDSEDALDMISRFLQGDVSAEELEALAGLEKNSPADDLLFPQAARAEKAIPDLEKSGISEEASVLKGFLSEEGELVYFEEAAREVMGNSLKKDSSSVLKSSSAQKNKVEIEINVTDLRKAQNENSGKSQELAASFQDKIASSADQGEPSEQLDMDLADDLLSGPAERLFSAEGAGGKLEAPVSKEVSRMFQNYMNETGNKELVRKIDFILKDSNQGEIKLILKPEALGNVRINLSLNENHIAGKIFVDNSSVRDIFLNNMDQLNTILKENGYEDAALEVWVGQQGRDGSEQESGEERGEEKHLRSVKGLEKLEESVPHAAYLDGSDNGQVNLII